jgi:creatinine amidohydrolase/Fe(II)-dependent formamide hydrolase-like protein
MKLAAEEGIPSSIGYTWWNIPQASKAIQEVTPGRGRIDHSGERETSIQLYLQPELVDKSAAVWARGVLGDPSLGTREKGERIITAAIDGLAEILRDYHSGKLENSLSTREGIFEGRKTI